MSSFAAASPFTAPRARAAAPAPGSRLFSARTVLGGVQLRPFAHSQAAVCVRPAARRSSHRLVVRAEEGDFEVPDFVKDLMKPPDASVAAPGWLAPLIGLAEEAGESAPVAGYGIMGATGVVFMLATVIAGLGAVGVLLGLMGTGYACWQASPYLAAISSRFDTVPEPTPTRAKPPAPEEDQDKQ